jgi:hypothetical protein
MSDFHHHNIVTLRSKLATISIRQGQVDGVTIVDIRGIVLGGGCAALGNLICDLLSKGQKKILFMVCSTCGSVTQRKFLSEVDIHFPRLRDVKKSPVLVYPELSVCLNCGKAEFTLSKEEVDLIAKSDAADNP